MRGRCMQPFMRRLLIGLLFISCNNFSKTNNASAQTIYSPVSKSSLVTAKPEIFETAFFEGTQVNADGIHLSFYSVDIGKINIESGKIIASDPIVMRDMKPFIQNFPTGQFPVHLAIAKINDDERVAFSRIMFSDKPVVKWEFALQNGQEPVSIFGDTMYSYGVDGGTGLFADEKANEAFTELEAKDDNLWQQVFIDEMKKHSHMTWEYALYNFNGHNIATFSTGLGDGHYATYVGYDDKGNICRLLTDFNLVGWWQK
jgi:hypothetical protein